MPDDSVQTLLELAQGNGDVVQVKVRVTIDDYPAALTGGDALVFHDASGDVRTLEDNGLPSGGEYEAEIATSETVLAIDFVRSSGLARTIPVDLPPPFTLALPTSLSRAGGVSVSWNADTAFPMSVSASGSECLPAGGWSRTFAVDPGFVTLQPADFISTPLACPIAFVAKRDGATETVSQLRTIFFDTKP